MTKHTLPHFQVNTPKFYYLKETISLQKGDEVSISYKKEGKGMVYFANKTQLFDELSVVIPADDFYTMAGYSLGLDGMLVRDIRIEVKEQTIQLWKPEDDEEYCVPHHGEFCTPNWRGNSSDKWHYKMGLCFKHEKHAEWVYKCHINPLILNAALAVDGLADFNNEEHDCHCITVYYKNQVNIVSDETGYLDSSKVWFKSKEKAEEALAIVHCGKTIRGWLEE